MTVGAAGQVVAVAGGGVAGAAACIALSRAGHRPLWFASRGPNLQEPFGESLSAAAGPILERLRLADLLREAPHRRSNAVLSAWGGKLFERSAALDAGGPGWVLDRRRFEADLWRAADAGAERCDGTLERATPTGSGWRLSMPDASLRSVAVLIDATGRAASIGRQLASYRRVDRLVAATAVLPHRDLSVEPTPATLVEAVETGWWYAALLPDQRLSIAFFSDPDLLPHGLSGETAAWHDLIGRTHYVGRWVEDAGFAVTSTPRLVSAGTAFLDPPAGITAEGAPWLAAGDAANGFDPLSSHGLTTALWSGMMAGEAAAKWLTGSDVGLRQYVNAAERGREEFLIQRTAHYRRERRYPGACFWSRRAGD